MPDWPRYVSVALKEAKAARKLRKLQRKNPHIRPVILQGRAIVQSWWGKAWCRNLERYADYDNRIGRGRSYVRHGAVLDLQIQPGRIEAMVQGSREYPYEVQIRIDRLTPTTWRHIRTACEGRIDSLQTLLSGTFPTELGDVFMTQGQGLFPSPNEIHFECSCPDWAGMCKHVAAVLYGIGARLDEEPALLFVLRGASVNDLVGRAVAATARKLLEQADAESNRERVIADADLSTLFGIDLEAPDAPAAKPRAAMGRRRGKKAPAAGETKKMNPPQPKRRLLEVPAPKANPPCEPPTAAAETGSSSASAVAARLSDDDTKIVTIIRRSRQGVNVAALQRHTGLDAGKIRAVIYAALRKGLIRRIAWGVFKGA
ncbi:MAG: hypothetical protein C4519_17435 [Desulfobacteraceae bacterium]|nr:MAG: hypothetical protein C4519_17435 [Desulfobacteraceae bacterium]